MSERNSQLSYGYIAHIYKRAYLNSLDHLLFVGHTFISAGKDYYKGVPPGPLKEDAWMALNDIACQYDIDFVFCRKAIELAWLHTDFGSLIDRIMGASEDHLPYITLDDLSAMAHAYAKEELDEDAIESSLMRLLEEKRSTECPK